MEEWTKEEVQNAVIEEPVVCVYLYTPICGTCQVAKKMMTVVQDLLPQLKIGMNNLNYGKELAEIYQIESVPCLLLVRDGKIQKRIYTFQSVPYLYNECKRMGF